MLYLLDANVLITANNLYYPIEGVPEYWEWLAHMGEQGHVKMPFEIFEEVKDGPDGDKDLLFAWLQDEKHKKALLLDEMANLGLVQTVLMEGYAPDLTDDELEQIGRDPFLIAYGLADHGGRCVVTVETSSPKKQRHKRKVPDVCNTFGQKWCNPFEFNKSLGFSTQWKKKAGV